MKLDISKFEITEIKETRDQKDFVELENQIKEYGQTRITDETQQLATFKT